MVRHHKLIIHDILEQFLSIYNWYEKILLIICIVRRKTCYHFVEKYSKKIPIDSLAMTKLLYHLRGQVSIRPTKWLGPILELSHPLFWKAEISQQSMPLFIQNYVIWFEVSK
jgi:hypothetical protein